MQLFVGVQANSLRAKKSYSYIYKIIKAKQMQT